MLGVGDHDLVSADREVEAWKCKDFVVRLISGFVGTEGDA